MFSLQNRGELPGVVESELENLISRLRKFLLKNHQEDGTHAVTQAGVKYEGVTYEGAVTSLKIINGIVVEVN